MRARSLAAAVLAAAHVAEPSLVPTPPPGVPPAQVLNASSLHGTCNDGSPQVVYFRPCSANWDRKDPHEDFCANITQRWIIVFDGTEGFCYDGSSCSGRDPRLRGSAWMPPSTFLDGALLPFAEANANLYKAHALFVPYCSSDLYIGSSEQFQGRSIVDEVFERYLAPSAPPPRLVDADQVLIVGPAGVLARIDALANTIRAAVPGAQPPGNSNLAVFGFLDGGVLPGRVEPFNASAAACTTDRDCPPAQALARAQDEWGLRNDTRGLEWCDFASSEPFRCLLADTLLPHLASNASTGVFVQQQQFDALLLGAFGAGSAANGTAAGTWAEAVLRPALLQFLQPVAASFSAACGGPSQLAVSSAFYHTSVRFEDAYGHTQLHPLLSALPSFLEDSTFSGLFRDNCTGLDCNPSGCAV